MNPIPVHCEIESPISYEHTSLMGKVCEHQFFSLDPIFEPILTPPFESRLDLSQIPESVSVFIPFPFESKSIISQNHTSLLNKDVEKNDSVIIFENWKLDGVIFSIRSNSSPTFLSNNKVWFWEMIDLDSNGIGIKTDTDSGIWLRSNRDSKGESKLIQKWGPN